MTLLRGIEHLVWVQVNGFAPVPVISNEDLERSSDEKTSAVHFMRFELDQEMVAALRAGAKLAIGVDHQHYQHQTQLDEAAIQALLRDFDAR